MSYSAASLTQATLSVDNNKRRNLSMANPSAITNDRTLMPGDATWENEPTEGEVNFHENIDEAPSEDTTLTNDKGRAESKDFNPTPDSGNAHFFDAQDHAEDEDEDDKDDESYDDEADGHEEEDDDDVKSVISSVKLSPLSSAGSVSAFSDGYDGHEDANKKPPAADYRVEIDEDDL